MSEKEICLQLLEAARGYTRGLLDGLSDDEWFAMPDGCPSHIAWQVGHIVLAQFGLCTARSFGPSPSDEGVLPANYVELFGRGSQPVGDPARYPSPDELREKLDSVHAYVMSCLRERSEDAFAAPAAEPFLNLKTCGDVVRFASLHEMLHAGQIGLIRRLLGKPPLR